MQVIFSRDEDRVRANVKNHADQEIELQKIVQKRMRLLESFEEKERALKDEATKREREVAAEHAKRVEEFQKVVDDRRIKAIEAQADAGFIKLSEAEQQIQEIRDRALERQIEALEKERDAYAKTLEDQTSFTEQIIVLHQRRAAAAEEASRRTADALLQESGAALPRLTPRTGGPEGPVVDNEAFDRQFGSPPPVGLWNEFRVAAVDAMSEVGNVGEQVFGMLDATFANIAQGVGAMVRSFVLLGTAGGSFRQLAAEVIASVAQMAVVQAVFELAQGLAMSALAWFTGNPKYAKSAAEHYAAAAVFGSIGAVATVAGRALAGNSFAGGGGGGGATSGAGGGTALTEEERTRREARRGGAPDPNQPVVYVYLNAKEAPGTTIEHVRSEYRRGGALRDMLRQDLLGEATG